MAILNISVFAGSPLVRGTSVYIRTLSEISSKNNEALDAVIDIDVKTTDGIVAIKKGTPVNANIERQKAKGVGKQGYIQITSMSTTSVDGQTIYLSGSVKEEGENKRGKVLGLGLGIGLCLFLPCLAILAKKGGEAIISSGKIYNQFSVAQEYQIQQ